MSDGGDFSDFRQPRGYAHLVMDDHGAIGHVYCVKDCAICKASPRERRWARAWRELLGLDEDEA
jgi:hypothetical protein